MGTKKTCSVHLDKRQVHQLDTRMEGSSELQRKTFGEVLTLVRQTADSIVRYTWVVLDCWIVMEDQHTSINSSVQ